MSAKYLLLGLLALLLINSCSSRKPVVDPQLILQNGTTFWNYKLQYVRLYEDYNAIDEKAKSVTRETFLRQLLTGRYLPLRLQSADSTAVYQLYPLPEKVDPNLKALLQQWAGDEYQYYRAEGKPLPNYHFVDMKGKVYSPQTMVGKIVVLKCWFVHCVACVAEMPALNALKQRYQNRSDIEFVSLCLDPRDKVATFLGKTKFDYATVANQTKYLENQLKIGSYPMHFVVNKQGLVVKQVDRYQGVVYTLNKM